MTIPTFMLCSLDAASCLLVTRYLTMFFLLLFDNRRRDSCTVGGVDVEFSLRSLTSRWYLIFTTSTCTPVWTDVI